MKECPVCFRSFLGNRPFQRFCSPRCQHRNWADRNRERIRELWRGSYRRNPETKIEYGKKYRLTHADYKEKQKARNRVWSKTERGRKLAATRVAKWRKTDRGYAYYQKRRRMRYALEVSAPGFHTKEQWDAELRTANGVCPMCKKVGVRLTKDHVIPLSMGGSDNIENIQPLCGPCNTRKGGRNRVSVGERPTGTTAQNTLAVFQ